MIMIWFLSLQRDGTPTCLIAPSKSRPSHLPVWYFLVYLFASFNFWVQNPAISIGGHADSQYLPQKLCLNKPVDSILDQLLLWAALCISYLRKSMWYSFFLSNNGCLEFLCCWEKSKISKTKIQRVVVFFSYIVMWTFPRVWNTNWISHWPECWEHLLVI